MSERPQTEEEKNRGTNKPKFGLDPYIVFDKVKGEIRMEIPFTVLMDPDLNKALGEIKKSEIVFDEEKNRYVYK